MWKALAVAVAAVLLLPVEAVALENDELLALVAMPLAVAAVADVADVPMTDLMSVVALLNDAAVPPAQFVEVVRYTPVVLMDEPARVEFFRLLRTQRGEGVGGMDLVRVIEDDFRTRGIGDVTLVNAEPRVDIDETFLVPVTATRSARRDSHPHGGPPGQIKKDLGLQTGAEVVHGTHPRTRGRGEDVGARVVGGVVDDDDDVERGRAMSKSRGQASREHIAEPRRERGNAERSRGRGANERRAPGKAKGKGKGGNG